MATSLNVTPTPITPPRVPLVDERTGLIDRSWYLFFLSLFRSAELIEDTSLAPSTESLIASYDAALLALAQTVETLPPQNDCCADVIAVRQETQSAPSIGVAELTQEVSEVRQQLQTLPRQELGTFAALQQANLPWTTFDTTPELVPETDTGTVYWSNDDATLNVVLEGGVTGQVFQQLDFHPKNTSGVQINKGQSVMATGVVGASTKITCAKAVTDGSVPAQYMLGIAAQDIPANSFGYVVWFGSVQGFNTTGANKTVPETWVDGDVLYFDPAYPGELTKVEPFAPNLDLPIAIVTNAANNGGIFVRMKTGETLDELHDVHAPTPAAGDVLVWDAVDGRWENAPASSLSATNLAGGVAGSVPYQSAPSTTTFLSIGAANTVITSSGTAPQWSTSLALAGTLGVGTVTPRTSVNIASSTGPSITIENTSTTVTSTGTYGSVDFYGNDASAGASGIRAKIEAISRGSAGESALVFSTATTGTAIQERFRIEPTGSVRVGTAALATTATNGFLYIPTCAGTPTGVPTAVTGLSPLVIDSTNNKLYFYSGGAWRDAGP